MKKMKKLLSLVLAMMLVLAMGSTAMAAPEETETGTGTITIDNAIPGQTYTIYKMFDLESYVAASNAYSYTVAAEWEAFVKNAETGGKYVELNSNGYVVWKDGADAEEFAKEALAYAKNNSNITGTTATAPSAEDGAETSKVTFNSLELGYYLLDSTTGALCSLDTTNPEATIQEKNEIPEIKKEVKEDFTDEFGQENTADVGDTVPFRVTITTKKGIQNYKFHDVMSAGLTFDSASVAVALDGDPVSADNYTVVTEGLDDGCTFEVQFTDDFLGSLIPNQEIVITYNATVNADAVIGKDGNTNRAILEYGDNNRTEEGPDTTTTTYVFEMGIYKYTGTLNTDDDTPLADAVFELRRTKDGDAIQFVKTDDNAYRVATPGEIADDTVIKVTSITTDDTGRFNLSGLDADTYYLVETAAPAGYNLLKDPIKVVITQNEESKEGVITVNDGTTPVTEVGVQNNTGAELPSTGGIGTTIFYVLGGILVVGACILLVVKKRMSSEE